jgi:hypothetical protein
VYGEEKCVYGEERCVYGEEKYMYGVDWGNAVEAGSATCRACIADETDPAGDGTVWPWIWYIYGRGGPVNPGKKTTRET